MFMFICHASSHILQKEMMDEAESDYVSEEVAAAAKKQLEDLNKSMEMNAG